MSIPYLMGELLVSEWLWSVTFGFYHLPINIFIMIFFFKFFMGMRIIPAVLLSFFSNIFSWIILSLFVLGVPVYLFKIGFDTSTTQTLSSIMAVSLVLGGLYALVQSLMFVVLDKRMNFDIHRAIAVALMSNGLTALMSYALVPNL